jgi:hypothetical protein
MPLPPPVTHKTGPPGTLWSSAVGSCMLSLSDSPVTVCLMKGLPCCLTSQEKSSW